MMSCRERFLLPCLLAFLFSLNPVYSHQSTLVLVDSLAIKETHSIFLNSLQERGHNVTVKLADDPSLVLSMFGEHIYNNLVLLSPGVEEFGGSLSVDVIMNFIDEGGNVLIAGNEATTDLIRELTAEVGVEMDEEGASVIDHSNFNSDDNGYHTLIAAPSEGLIKCKEMVGVPSKTPLLYRGTGIIADPDNDLILPVLRAPSTAYSHNPLKHIKEYPHAVGKNMLLIAALQARNNARVVISGSIDFFSNAFIFSSAQDGKLPATSGNGPVIEALSRWVFKEEGVLRVVSVSHHHKGEKEAPPFYTIKDEAVFNIVVERLVNGVWKPFEASDMQMEFVRIDPFVRLYLKPSSSGKFSVDFMVPDVYGVYQFKVEYNRVGFTRLYSTTQVSVRPFTHTQYERFIDSAYPYYCSAFSMMVGVFLFSLVFLHHKEPSSKSKAE